MLHLLAGSSHFSLETFPETSWNPLKINLKAKMILIFSDRLKGILFFTFELSYHVCRPKLKTDSQLSSLYCFLHKLHKTESLSKVHSEPFLTSKIALVPWNEYCNCQIFCAVQRLYTINRSTCFVIQ